jgi:hypothetical protein
MDDITPIKTDKNGRDDLGRFTVDEGNTGRPKGAKNKTTKELNKLIVNFLNEKTEDVFQIWERLDDKDKATLFLQLCKLVMPKANEDKAEETEPTSITFVIKQVESI